MVEFAKQQNAAAGFTRGGHRGTTAKKFGGEMTGEEIYEIAIDMIDKFDKRFCDMMDEDSKLPILARKYFALDDEYVCGWGRFRKTMLDGGNSEWLRRIESLDEQKNDRHCWGADYWGFLQIKMLPLIELNLIIM